MRLTFVDTETSGLPPDAGVCDIAIVTIDDNFNVVYALESLIDPERPIGAAASGVHGIVDSMVADAPTLSEFMEMHGHPLDTSDLVFVAHSSRFDEGMLKAHLPRQYKRTCTLKLARNLFPDLENHQLQTIRFAFGLQAGPAHRAMGDVITCISFVRHICRTKGWTLAQLVDAANQPLSLDSRISFGKHKGTKLRDVPKSYLSWALREMKELDPELRAAFQAIVSH